LILEQHSVANSEDCDAPNQAKLGLEEESQLITQVALSASYPVWPIIGAIDEANISATHTLFRVTTHSSSQSSSAFYCSARASRTSSGLAALVKRDCSWFMLFE
jgi:hypothetical protein